MFGNPTYVLKGGRLKLAPKLNSGSGLWAKESSRKRAKLHTMGGKFFIPGHWEAVDISCLSRLSRLFFFLKIQIIAKTFPGFVAGWQARKERLAPQKQLGIAMERSKQRSIPGMKHSLKFILRAWERVWSNLQTADDPGYV